MKEILKALGEKDTIAFKKAINKKNVRALEVYSDKGNGYILITIYRCRCTKVGQFYFEEQDYFERLNNYQYVCDCLINSCDVNRGKPSDRTIHFNPEQSKEIKSIVIWYSTHR